MVNRETIDKWSVKYWMAKYLWAKPVFNLYYRKIELNNVQIIPRNKPVILAPNHQNALMDAMALVTQIPFQTVFMARADIFRKPIIIKLLTFMKIMPIYRIRDGISSLGQNEEIFEETTRILRNHYNPLCLFPEGNHGEKRRLRPLVKGIFRIALKAQSDYGSKPGIQIIPVGIDYKHYQKFGQSLFVNFGQPIEVSEYWDMYCENQAVAINALRDRLADEMRKYMIDIKTDEFYDTYMGLRGFYRPEAFKRLNITQKSLTNQFIADKKLIDALDKLLERNPGKMKDIDEKFCRYASLRDKNKLRDWVFRKSPLPIISGLCRLLSALLLSPLFLLGLINNWPHFFIPIKFAGKIKDPQFRSTAAWGMGIVIQAVYYLILSVLAFVFLPKWWMAAAYIVLMPLTGLIAYEIRRWFIKGWKIICFSLKNKKSAELTEALELKNVLTKLLNSLPLD